jgi:hypothetical protein
MLQNELLCYEKKIDFFLLVVLSYLPKPTKADIKTVRSKLRKDKTLGLKGWQHLVAKLPPQEHAAYDLPIANVINGIIAATPGIYGEKPTPSIDTLSPEAKTRVRAWNESNANRAFISDGDRTWVSERPDPAKSGGALLFLGGHRKSEMSENIEKIYAEDISLCAEFKVPDTEVRYTHTQS